MQELGLVQYTQPSDVKRSYPAIIIVEVNKPGSPAHGKYLVSKATDIAKFVYRYRLKDTQPSYQYPKILQEYGIVETDLVYWIPTKIKIYDVVHTYLRDGGYLLNRLTNKSPTVDLIVKPRRFSGERGPSTTPCVGICSTTNCGDDICKGCGRTAEQVIMWNSYDEEEKLAINNVLKSIKS